MGESAKKKPAVKKPSANKPRKTEAQKRAEAEAVPAVTTTPPENSNDEQSPPENSNDEQSNPPEENNDEQSNPPEENNDEQSNPSDENSDESEVDESGQSAEGLSEYRPKQRPLQAAGLDQHAEYAKREAERDAERDEHNRRTGDVSRQGWNH